MALDTNLSRSPYFDTFNTDSGYHQILFRPAVAVQTRELNELQSIQQDQIAKFGRQIFTEGSVVEGCQLSFESNIPYVKIIDEYANGSVFGNVNEFLGLTVINSANISAIILNTYPGSNAKAPDLNTLYIRYTQAGDNGEKFFVAGEQLTLYTVSGNPVGNVVIANTTISGVSAPTGVGYIVHAQEGVIFQKGFFTRAEPQSYILSKYDSFPDKVSIGYTTIETIDTPESNTALLDNASGAPNYSAPGAHRLKLTPVLTSRETFDTTTSTSFFAIADFAEGQPSIVRTDPSYSNLGKQLAKRTFDESGNYIIDPFFVRLATKYDTNGDIVADELKLEIEKGLAYVNGYRVETIGKLISSIRRGTDTKTIDTQTTTASMGSYIFVNEFSGIFDPTSFQKVSLRSAVTTSISGRTPGDRTRDLSPGGSEIGTANIIGIEYDSGVPGTASCIYRMYLTNIICSNFSSVKSIYATNGSTKEGYADPALEFGKCVLKDTTLQTLTFPYAQKAIKTLFSFTNLNKNQFDFKAKTAIEISNIGKASIPVQDTTGGNNFLPYTANRDLNNIQERDFIITCTNDSAGVSAANVAGYITGSSGSAVITGTGTFFTTEFANGNLIRIANVSNTPIYKRILEVNSDTQITLTTTLGSTQTGTGTFLALYIVAGEQIGSSVLPNATITISENQKSANLTLNRSFSDSFTAEAIYNVRRSKAVPLKKKLFKDLLVKIDTSTATKKNIGPWCLGIPDVYRVKKVYVGTDSGYDVANMTDQTSSFILDNGQNDAFYGLSYISKKTGVTIPASRKIVVQFDAFLADFTTGAGYFSVDSYPIDDTGITANTILTQDIPLYNSSTSGQYDLRNTIDFRVQMANTAVYNTSISFATTNPATNTALVFDGPLLKYVPVPDSSFEADLEYYVGRYDKVGLDSFGNVKVVEGSPDENPIPPGDIATMMTLAMIKVPPYPSLPPSEALSSGRADLSSDITYYKNRRYTMRDISALDKRIENLEYYTTLNTLELSTKTLLIDNGTGGNRFQYGLLVDPMRGHDIGNVTDPQYRIAIDYSATEARPMVQEIRVDLNYKTTTGTRLSTNGRLISLDYPDLSTINYISQPFASKYRNCSQDVTYVYNGHIKLFPEGDWTPTFKDNPGLNINLDLYSNFAAIADALGTVIGTYVEVDKVILNTTNPITTVTGQRAGEGVGAGWGTTDTDYTTKQTVTSESKQEAGTKKLSLSESKNTKYDFGDIVQSVALQPFINDQKIQFHATGMKPNSILYAFFDETDITQYCKKFVNFGQTLETTSVLQADATGEIYGYFDLPAKTFYAGERLFRLVDVINLDQGTDFIQSEASSTFFGTNLSYTKENVTLNTTSGQLSVTRGIAKKSVIMTNEVTRNFTITTDNPNPDPIIQSFKVNEPDNIAGIFLKSLDLWFFKKDAVRGIRVEIREMFNGFPGFKVLPFSSSYLKPSSVNISSNASPDKRTTFVFDAPVFVENKKDYAICVLPDGASPDYAIWVAEQGGVDIFSNTPIFNNSDVGVMFTSSDNKTWTPYQKEDIKFGLNICDFSPRLNNPVNVNLENDDTEYLSANDLIGTFETNEKVYFSNNTIDTQVVVVSTSTTMTNVASASSILVNDMIYIRNSTGSNTIIRKVSGRDTVAKTITVEGLPTFSDSVSTIGKLSGNGDFYGYVKNINYSNGYIMIGNSTANSGVHLTESHKILAATSQASATISTINTVKYNVVMPKFAISSAPLTDLTFSLKGLSNTYGADNKFYNLVYAQEAPFYDKERVVLSKSDEYRYNTGAKSLTINATFSTTERKLSPIIDLIKCGIITTHNIVNYDYNTDKNKAVIIQYDGSTGTFNVGQTVRLKTTGTPSESQTGNVVYSYASNTTHGTIIINYLGGETSVDPSVFIAGANVSVSSGSEANIQYVNTSLTILATEKTPGQGTAKARYTSKKVVLADGNEAQDIKVYVAAYKPAGTDMFVFAKFWNGADPELFDSKHWTQLQTDNALVSSKANINDFIEYEYRLTQTTDPYDYTAYLDSGILTYKNRDGSLFTEYKSFSIKIVLLSSDSSIVPRIQDYRAIALSDGNV